MSLIPPPISDKLNKQLWEGRIAQHEYRSN